MGEQIASQRFDYKEVSGDQREVLVECARTYRRASSRETGAVLEKARAIFAASQTLTKERGFFKWVQAECDISWGEAYHLIHIHQTFGTLGEEVVGQFDKHALRSLSTTTAPKKALEKAIDIAESGERVTAMDAKKLIANSTVDAPPQKVKKVLGNNNRDNGIQVGVFCLCGSNTHREFDDGWRCVACDSLIEDSSDDKPVKITAAKRFCNQLESVLQELDLDCKEQVLWIKHRLHSLAE